MRITESQLRRVIREVIKEASDVATMNYIVSVLGKGKAERHEKLKMMMARHVLNRLTGVEKGDPMSCEQFVESLFGGVEQGVKKSLIKACEEGDKLAREVNMTKEERFERDVGHFPSAR